MKVTSLPNIGPGLERMLATINIKTAEELLASDPLDLYIKLEQKQPGLHLAVLASFVGAQNNVPWHLIYQNVKKDYLAKFKA